MEKACIFCKHFYIDSGYPPYSEYTPGEDASLGCHKAIWELSGYSGWDEKDWKAGMVKAQDCEFYEYIPLSEIGGRA